MTDKEQIMIDINKCKFRDKYTNYCLAERNDIGESYTICTGTNCYFKQLARKTQECEAYKKQLEFVRTHRTVIDAEKNRYRKALEEIEEVCKNGVYDEFKMPLDECDLILDIINKAKGE